MSNEVKQTSQAILFEEFNPGKDKDNLRTMLENENVEEAQFTEKVREKLGVNSFQEFLDKFAPDLWEYFSDGKFYYTTDEDKARKMGGVKKSITDNTYYQALVNMYSQKGNSGLSNSQFDDSELLDMLSPQREIKEAKRVRTNFAYLTKEFYKALDAGEDTKEYVEKIYNCRDKIIDKYKESKVALLPLAINTVSQKIETLEDKKKAINALTNGSVPQLTAGQFSFDKDGNVFLLEAAPTEKLPDSDRDSQHDIAGNIKAMIEADYEENFEPVSEADTSGPFIEHLMVSVYAPGTSTADNQDSQALALTEETINTHLAELKEQKASYEGYYLDAKKAFIQELSKIIEKVIGVKIFFDHATAGKGDKAKLEVPAGLIVANCKPADLVEENLKPKFQKYIENIGKSQTTYKCWFAILPHIQYAAASTAEVTADQLRAGDDPLLRAHKRTKKQDNVKAKAGDALNLNVAKSMLSVLDEGHIVTVFNFEAFKGNTFNDLTAESLKETKKKLTQDYNIDYAHAVYAYPDFTLMQERSISVTDELKKKLFVPAIHIDAAYPAAGLLVASQQLSTLKERGLGEYLVTDADNVNPIRIDLENTLVQEHLTTYFNRENVMNWSHSVLDTIQEDQFGFSFCGNEIATNIANTYIFTARTMKKKGNRYKPIYQVLMEDYLFLIVDGLLHKKKSQVQEILLNKYVPKWKQLAKKYTDKDKMKINLVLQPGENIDWDKDKENRLKITFKNGEDTLDSIAIDSEEAKEE